MRRQGLKTEQLELGVGKVKYSPHTGVNNAANRCDDCVALLREWHDGGEQGASPPPAKHAKFKRVQGKSKKILCAEHKTHRQEQEAMKQ